MTLLLVFQEANTSERRGRGSQHAQLVFEGYKALQAAPLPRAASLGIAQAPEGRCKVLIWKDASF